jgi:hypothetical protein
MTIKKKATILSDITTDLADNNAGSISAEDVRSNMYDAVESINSIVGSGNHDSSHPFVYNVRASNADGSHGLFIAESGVQFPNQVGGSCTQIMCYPGPYGISHNDLADLTTGDVHTQYYMVDGSRPMLGNVTMQDTYWIGSSGVNNAGLKFVYAPRTGNPHRNDIHVGMSGDFLFQADQSRLSSSQGVAKAWINFDGSGVGHIPVVRASYNVADLKHHSRGKYTVTFNSGVLENNSYVVVATSNSTTASGSMEDFDVNTVGAVMRYGSENDGVEKFRKCTFVVRNDAGEYVDGEINDLVIFGAGSGVTASTCNVTKI